MRSIPHLRIPFLSSHPPNIYISSILFPFLLVRVIYVACSVVYPSESKSTSFPTSLSHVQATMGRELYLASAAAASEFVSHFLLALHTILRHRVSISHDSKPIYGVPRGKSEILPTEVQYRTRLPVDLLISHCARSPVPVARKHMMFHMDPPGMIQGSPASHRPIDPSPYLLYLFLSRPYRATAASTHVVEPATRWRT